ncbi:MAG: peptide chain release factor N(5)-glutamine methyltransferase [Candidatus Dormibacterales bacterium]
MLPLLEVLRRATGYLEGHGSESPRLDAELLLAHALGLRRIDLYLQHERPLDEADLAPFRALVARRGQGEPVAYLTGHKEFMALEFEVTPAVLVPNPDTETLVRRAIEWGRARGGPLRFADVGTGSGCVAVAVAHYLPLAEVEAVDDDPAALEVAGRNVGRHGLGDRVALHQGHLLEPVEGRLDGVLANLPYVPSGRQLPAEVTAQPAHALFAGESGGELVAALLEQAAGRLVPGGVVLAEADGEVLKELADLAGRQFGTVRLHNDLGGRERVLEAWNS